MTEIQTSQVETKIPVNIQEVPQVMSSVERAKEFREQLNAIESKRLAEINQKTNEENVEEERERPEVIDEVIDDSIDNTVDTDNSNNDLLSIEPDDLDNELDNKHIPKKRLDKELSKRRELEVKLQEEREARIRLETEMNVYNDALKRLNQQNQEEVEPELDPIDSDAHRLYMRKIAELEKRLDEKTDNLSNSNEQLRYENTLKSQANDFIKKQPDFQEAYDYIIKREAEGAKLLGIPDEQMASYLGSKLSPIEYKVYKDGGNVAETMYKLAQSYGYQGKTAKKNGVNLKAIEKNERKSSSIIDDVPSASVGITSSMDGATKLNNFNDIMSKAGADKDVVFRQMIEKIKNAR